MPWFGPDRATEDDALGCIRGRLVDEPAPVADALRRDQDPLRVHAVEDVAEPLALLADERVRRHLQAVDEDLRGGVVDHRLDRADRHRSRRRGPLHVDDERREALRLLLHLLERRRPREEQHEVGVERPRRPDLLPVDDVAAVRRSRRSSGCGSCPSRPSARSRRTPAAAARPRRSSAGSAASARRSRAAGSSPSCTSARGRRRVAAGRVDLLEDHARRREREPGAAVLLRDQGGEPAVSVSACDERLRVPVGLELAPVLAGELRAELAHRRANLGELLGRREVHRGHSRVRRSEFAPPSVRQSSSW